MVHRFFSQYTAFSARILFFTLTISALCAVFFSCSRTEEMTLEQIESIAAGAGNPIIEQTVSKPWKGEEFADGKTDGSWFSSITSDPKSFNLLIAERDGETAGILAHMHDYLVDYDYVSREFKPHAASFRIDVNEEKQTLSVYYTLRDDMYWSWYGSDRKEKVTSDDVVFWYDEIEGDKAFNSSAYNSQFVEMEDGSLKRVTIEKIDELNFAFHFPRIDSNPLLSTNRTFGPRRIYEQAKKEGGIKGVQNLLTVASDPKTIPSMGMWFLTEYSPGQRLVFKRNPDYWKKDKSGISIPYPEEKIVQIVSDQNTRYLLFKEGKQEVYSPRPEEIDEIVKNAGSQYTVYNAAGSLGASFWSFNQNPQNAGEAYYEWFTQKEFRQAMSCLLNRKRIISQTYRGLAEPKYTFFPEANPFYNPDISLPYVYNTAHARQLLAKIGIAKDEKGIMRDSKGRAVEFDLTIPADNTISVDIASIITDECAKEGIKVRIRTIDFQKIVEQLTSTYDWQSLIIGLGSNYWPTQGSNVWPSTGNLHLWHPLQEKPSTEWEARIDYLYNEGSCTIDREKAFEIWDEYQSILLEQCPVIYLVRPRSFSAMQNRWDHTNVYYDNIGSLQTDNVYLKQ